MSDPSTDPIVWRVHLASPPEKVFEMLATDEGRAAFWAESAEGRAGEIHFQFVSGVATRSRIIESSPPSRFVIDYFDSEAAFDLLPDGSGGTDLTLTNTGYDPAEYDEILPGWLNVLFPLKAAVDFNIDLRTHDPQRTWERRYIDQ